MFRYVVLSLARPSILKNFTKTTQHSPHAYFCIHKKKYFLGRRVSFLNFLNIYLYAICFRQLRDASWKRNYTSCIKRTWGSLLLKEITLCLQFCVEPCQRWWCLYYSDWTNFATIYKNLYTNVLESTISWSFGYGKRYDSFRTSYFHKS